MGILVGTDMRPQTYVVLGLRNGKFPPVARVDSGFWIRPELQDGI